MKKLPASAHMSRPWRIHAIAPDFALEDVWALDTPGGPDDLPRFVEVMASFDPAAPTPGVVGFLFAVRWKLGALLGWDDDRTDIGSRVASLRERLPADLREPPEHADLVPAPFRALYATDDEWAAEVANNTMHGIMHIGWVRDDDGAFRGQMAVLVKPNGWLGQAYMAAIKPFRYAVVYPRLLRAIEHRWCTRYAERPSGV